MANKLLTATRSGPGQFPSEIEYEGAFRGTHGISECNQIVVTSETYYEPQFPGVTVHMEPSAAADGDPHILEGWPTHRPLVRNHRIPWAPNVQSNRNFARNVYVSPPENPHSDQLLWNYRNECKRAVRELLNTAGEQSWDGADADPVMEDTVEVALEISDQLPSDVGIPEISADPEGNIEFDWQLDNGTMFTISVGRVGDIAISGLCAGESRMSGTLEDRKGKTFLLLQCGLNWLREMKER